MADYLLLMRDDVTRPVDDSQWPEYLAKLSAAGAFRGGSEIGGGVSVRRAGEPAPMSAGLTGFVRIEATDTEHAVALTEGNPVHLAGGTIEIRELPRTGD